MENKPNSEFNQQSRTFIITGSKVFILEEDSDNQPDTVPLPIGIVVTTEEEAKRWRDQGKRRIYSTAVIKDRFDD